MILYSLGGSHLMMNLVQMASFPSYLYESKQYEKWFEMNESYFFLTLMMQT